MYNNFKIQYNLTDLIIDNQETWAVIQNLELAMFLWHNYKKLEKGKLVTVNS